MVINEKTLVREIKDAYKGGGYTVIMRPGGRTAFWTPAWLAEIENENLPREVLAVLALHMGCLPEEGKAYKILKGKDEPYVQTMLFETAIAPVRVLDNSVEEADTAPAVEVRKTALTLDGWSVWQKTGNNGVMLIDPAYESLLRKLEDVVVVHGGLYKEGEISRLHIVRGVEPGYERQLDHLSGIPWVGK